ncbi:tetratricopeptide repeat (TPR)-like superfamily protein [Actinidia rufa]|uniref:Tetratricopeptide repeat (TPR)-like superfamily protein n=1 Tax=Actinidia rufa TaxID=165716 RepID=A0A7J0FSM3_9ERIC|nr:tetratricopeptide repeat (TPR)-like superfamily protein [Actinidia rufa]
MRHGRRRTSLYSSALLVLARNKTTTSTSATSELQNLLLVAAVVKALSENGGSRNLDENSVPLTESLVLQVLKRSSLDVSKKLDFFRWCSLRKNYKHSTNSYTQIFRAICRRYHNHNHHEIIDLLSSMKREGVILDSGTFKLLLDAFIRMDKFDSAIEILDHMEEELGRTNSSLNSDVYNSVLVALVRREQVGLALSIFFKLLEATNGNNGNDNGNGNAGCIIPDAIVCNELFVALRKADMRDEFRRVFDKLKEKQAVCMSLSLFREMKERSQGSDGSFGPDLCTYNSLIHILCLTGKGCCKSYWIDNATKIFSEMQYSGFCPDTVVYNSILDGLLKARRLTEACQLFEKMVEDGVRASCWTHNILIDGLFKNGRAAAGYTLFCDLKKKGQFVDGITYSIVILCLCREGQLEEALQLVEEMEARGFVVDLVTITSLLIGLHRQWSVGLAKKKDFTPMFPSKGDFSDIMKLISSHDLGINTGPGSKASGQQDEEFASHNIDQWSSSPYMDRLANEANSNDHSFQTFSLSRGRRVQVKGVYSFDIDMVNTYLSIFLAKGKLSLACKLFEIFTDMGVNPVSYTYNSMISSFVKKGYFDEAWGVLHEMSDNVCPTDIATYNMIIQGLGKMGKADLASAVLDNLMGQGGYLDIVMYNTLINAVGKAGRVDEASKFFEQMRTSGINPDVVTYNTLIEVHSKAGRLKDAYKFLKMMLDAGCPPNHVTDTTLDFLEKEIEKQRYQKASIRRTDKGDFS